MTNKLWSFFLFFFFFIKNNFFAITELDSCYSKKQFIKDFFSPNDLDYIELIKHHEEFLKNGKKVKKSLQNFAIIQGSKKRAQKKMGGIVSRAQGVKTSKVSFFFFKDLTLYNIWKSISRILLFFRKSKSNKKRLNKNLIRHYKLVRSKKIPLILEVCKNENIISLQNEYLRKQLEFIEKQKKLGTMKVSYKFQAEKLEIKNTIQKIKNDERVRINKNKMFLYKIQDLEKLNQVLNRTFLFGNKSYKTIFLEQSIEDLGLHKTNSFLSLSKIASFSFLVSTSKNKSDGKKSKGRPFDLKVKVSPLQCLESLEKVRKNKNKIKHLWLSLFKSRLKDKLKTQSIKVFDKKITKIQKIKANNIKLMEEQQQFFEKKYKSEVFDPLEYDKFLINLLQMKMSYIETKYKRIHFNIDLFLRNYGGKIL